MSVPTAYSYAIYGVPATDLLDDVKPKYDEDCGESYIGTGSTTILTIGRNS
jgi:hypothetical protein